MERLAEWAGVSKALPYSHFENSDDVLVALYGRVVGELGARVLAAVESADGDDDRVAVVIAAYLDTVADLGPVLGAVTAPGSLTAELADGGKQVGPRFVRSLLVEQFAVDESRARAAAPILLAALTGAATAWATRDATRAQAESLSTTVLRALLAD